MNLCESDDESDNDRTYIPKSSEEDTHSDQESKKCQKPKDQKKQKISKKEEQVSEGNKSSFKIKVDAVHTKTITRNGVQVEIADYNRKQICFYCDQSFAKLSRHLENSHADKVEVKKLKAMAVKTMERRKQIKYLANLGSYKANIATLRKGEGNLIVAKRPRSGMKREKECNDYYPCMFCLSFYAKEELWRHVRLRCEFRKESETKELQNYKGDVLAHGRALLDRDTLNDELLASLLSKLKADEVAAVVRQDELGSLREPLCCKQMCHIRTSYKDYLNL